jgi:hypothetical protein
MGVKTGRRAILEMAIGGWAGLVESEHGALADGGKSVAVQVEPIEEEAAVG